MGCRHAWLRAYPSLTVAVGSSRPVLIHGVLFPSQAEKALGWAAPTVATPALALHPLDASRPRSGKPLLEGDGLLDLDRCPYDAFQFLAEFIDVTEV